MKRKIGDEVLIKSQKWYDKNKNSIGTIDCSENFGEAVYFKKNMQPFLGEEVTIETITPTGYTIIEDNEENIWTDKMFDKIMGRIMASVLIPPPTKEEKLIQFIKDNSNLCPEAFNILIESYLDSLIPYNHGNFEISKSCNIDAISVTNRIKELRDEYKGSDFSTIVENIIKRLSKRELAFLMLANYITAK